MECPKCRADMIVVEYQGVELDRCVECGGTWFDRDELELLFDEMGNEAIRCLPAHAESLPEAATKEERRRCPLCGKAMRKVLAGPRQDVLIDVCPRGEGLWFDDTEVAELADEVLKDVHQAPATALRFLGDMFRSRKSTGEQEGGSQ